MAAKESIESIPTNSSQNGRQREHLRYPNQQQSKGCKIEPIEGA
jgi:hypothetical protein